MKKTPERFQDELSIYIYIYNYIYSRSPPPRPDSQRAPRTFVGALGGRFSGSEARPDARGRPLGFAQTVKQSIIVYSMVVLTWMTVVILELTSPGGAVTSIAPGRRAGRKAP